MKLHLRLVLVFLGAFALLDSVRCQTDSIPEPNTLEKLAQRTLIGGGFGLQFGSVTLLHVAPGIAYKLNERIYLGGSFTYQYLNWAGTVYESHMYGTRIFPIVDVWKGVFATAEYEWLNYPVSPDIGLPFRKNNHACFLGGGYLQRINKRGGFIQFSLLYNLLFSRLNQGQSPYDSPITYRMSVFF